MGFLLRAQGRAGKLSVMQVAKDTKRAVVHIGYDGTVSKLFRGHQAKERFENEVLVLEYLERMKCPFVPRIIDKNGEKLFLVTSNGGARVDQLSEQKMTALFQSLEQYGVRHEDQAMRNVTYNAKEGRFFLIDFEFATLINDPLHRSPVALPPE